MLGFFAFALISVGVLTGVVLAARLKVRKALSPALAILLTLAFVGIVLAAWWFVTRGERVDQRLVPRVILPAPLEVLQAFPRLHFEQELIRSAIVSFRRVAQGFGLAVLVAVPLGVYMATFPAVAAFFRPLALIGSYVPIVIFIPLTLAWFGTGEKQKVGFLFIACFVALLPLVIKSISDVPAAYLDVAVTKGATQWQLVRHVLFPVAMADIWDHLRGIYGIGWGWIILAEVYGAERGLGYLLYASERRSNTPALVAVAVVIVVIAILVDQVWKFSGRFLFPYRASNAAARPRASIWPFKSKTVLTKTPKSA